MSGERPERRGEVENAPREISGPEYSSGTPEEVCPVCCSPLLPGEESVVCPDCRSAYHKECWEENHGCAIYGCRSAPARNVPSEIAEHKKAGMPHCPRCQTLLRPEMRFCPVCGQKTNMVPISDLPSQIAATLKQKLSLLRRDAVRLAERLKPHLSFAWRSYWSNLKEYAGFRGKTPRRDFLNYLAVEFVISLLLGLLGKAGLVLNILFWIGTFLPTVGAVVRRLHDAGLSAGYFCALPLLPLLLLVPSEGGPCGKSSFATESKPE